jgi:hypothetical protein
MRKISVSPIASRWWHDPEKQPVPHSQSTMATFGAFISGYGIRRISSRYNTISSDYDALAVSRMIKKAGKAYVVLNTPSGEWRQIRQRVQFVPEMEYYKTSGIFKDFDIMTARDLTHALNQLRERAERDIRDARYAVIGFFDETASGQFIFGPGEADWLSGSAFGEALVSDLLRPLVLCGSLRQDVLVIYMHFACETTPGLARKVAAPIAQSWRTLVISGHKVLVSTDMEMDPDLGALVARGSTMQRQLGRTLAQLPWEGRVIKRSQFSLSQFDRKFREIGTEIIDRLLSEASS